MTTENSHGELLTPYRGYLLAIAQAQIGRQLQGKLTGQKHEQQIQLANALMELPDDQREVVILKHLKNQTLQQIADETQRTVPAIAGLLRRGLAKLREIMEQ